MTVLLPEAEEAAASRAGASATKKKAAKGRAPVSSTTGKTVRRNRSGYKKVQSTRGETTGGYEGFTMSSGRGGPATPSDSRPKRSSRSPVAFTGSGPQPRRISSKSSRGRRSSLSLPRSDKRRTSPLRKTANRSPVLVAEYFAAVLIIAISLFTRAGKEGYQNVISGIMLRLTALTGVFFVLFLMASGKRSGQVAALLGLLVDLGVLYEAVQKNVVADFASLIQGQGVNVSGTVLASSTKEKEYHDTTP